MSELLYEDDEGNPINAVSVMAWVPLPKGWLRVLLTLEGVITDLFDHAREEVLGTTASTYDQIANDLVDTGIVTLDTKGGTT
jgi:hypothetical protein